MALSVKHTFQSAKADSGDASLVRPSNWNAEHTITTDGNTLLGKPTAGSGAVVPIGVGIGLTFSSGNLVSAVTDSQAQLDAKFNGRVAKTGDIMTGSLEIQINPNPRLWLHYPNVKRASWVLDLNGTLIWSDQGGQNHFYITNAGALWCQQFGDVATRIEDRCNAFRNTCVTAARSAGFVSVPVKTGSSGGGDINNSGYFLTRAVKTNVEEVTFESRQPQLYIANNGWFAAFPF